VVSNATISVMGAVEKTTGIDVLQYLYDELYQRLESMDNETDTVVVTPNLLRAYHIAKIQKGVVGEISKIREEWEELVDAHNQCDKVMELCELTDLLGALRQYAIKYYDVIVYDDALKAAQAAKGDPIKALLFTSKSPLAYRLKHIQQYIQQLENIHNTTTFTTTEKYDAVILIIKRIVLHMRYYCKLLCNMDLSDLDSFSMKTQNAFSKNLIK
jgi:hypothetical protein